MTWRLPKILFVNVFGRESRRIQSVFVSDARVDENARGRLWLRSDVFDGVIHDEVLRRLSIEKA